MESVTQILPLSGVEAHRYVSMHGSKEKTILVFIVGFMGSTKRQMERYVIIYFDILMRLDSASDHEIILLMPPVSFVFNTAISSNSSINGYGALSQDMHGISKSIITSVNIQPSILLHVCSNAGAFLVEALQSINSFWSHVVGIVYDSSPVDITSDAIKNASKAVLGNLGSDIALTILHNILPESGLEDRRKTFEAMFTSDVSSLAGPLSSIPRLFLYSTSDNISDSKFIQGLIRPSIDRFYNFEVTGHMEHLKTFPKIYSDQIEQFLDIAYETRKRIIRSKL